MKSLLLYLLIGTLISFADFPKTQTVDGKTLSLNGSGLFEVSFLAIDIYTAALYLESKSKSAQEILSSKAPKMVVLKFERDAGPEKIIKGWNKGMTKVLKTIPPEVQKPLDEFNGFMKEVKKGELLYLTLRSDKVTARRENGEEKSFNGTLFSHSLLSLWLSENCIDDDVKSGMLGLES